GLNDILIACVDGLKGFPDAINTVYPEARIQLCIVHMARNSLRCQRQDYWPFFAIFNVRYWSLMLSAFRHFIITDWRGV
ncbi:transposase, partial [Escherichia coli]|uniref:transposase n=1 Tax=Escherichia coli TaxID=562 RepID=UPI0021C1D01D